MRKVLLTFLITTFVMTSVSLAGVPQMADSLISAYEHSLPIPVLSQNFVSLDLDCAYAVQKAFVGYRLQTDSIGGFKAGLTTPGAQKKFGVPFPVAGVLFAAGAKPNYSVIDRADFHNLMIETEIGFIIGKPITRPLKNIAELKEHITFVLPAIELPDLGFTNLKVLKGIDLIAANVAAVQYIPGSYRLPQNHQLNDVKVILYRDGQQVNCGHGTDALGDQWQAALWLVNTMIEQGWTIDKGHILLTGALGNMIPGKPGHYLADYGSFGKIEFEIR